MELAAWKATAEAGEAARETLRKGYAPDSVKAEDGKYSFTISTGAVDRDRDKIAVDGWNLANYRKNPIVLLNHDRMGLPIGKAETVLASGGALKARVVFADYPLAQTVRGLVDGNFMRATSVGFVPIKWQYDEERRGYDFLEAELLEFSIVTVPSNPEALLDAKLAGVDLAPLKGWAERVLDGIEPGLWLPKDTAERVLKIAAGDPASVVVEKRGRALSAANEGRLREAKGHLDGVLASVEAEDDDDKSARPVVRLRSPRPAPENLSKITRDEVLAAIQGAATKAAVRAVNDARGRLE
jgi:HK97 family phage prohead protease